jgi:hypothetical protein
MEHNASSIMRWVAPSEKNTAIAIKKMQIGCKITTATTSTTASTDTADVIRSSPYGL